MPTDTLSARTKVELTNCPNFVWCSNTPIYCSKENSGWKIKRPENRGCTFIS